MCGISHIVLEIDVLIHLSMLNPDIPSTGRVGWIWQLQKANATLKMPLLSAVVSYLLSKPCDGKCPTPGGLLVGESPYMPPITPVLGATIIDRHITLNKEE